MHLFPRGGADGHFNVLRGAVPRRFAGVKVVGDFVGNHARGLPSELALLLLLDPMTGVPPAILDATAITEMRTGAVTAIGAGTSPAPDARVLGHIGAAAPRTGTCGCSCHVLPALEEIRVHSRAAGEPRGVRRPARATISAAPCAPSTSWEECVRGADVVVEATPADRAGAAAAHRVDRAGRAGRSRTAR